MQKANFAGIEMHICALCALTLIQFKKRDRRRLQQWRGGSTGEGAGRAGRWVEERSAGKIMKGLQLEIMKAIKCRC